MRNALIVIGAILIVLGIFAYVYTITIDEGIIEGEDTEAPYRPYSYPLIIIGIVIIIIGLVYPEKDEYLQREMVAV